MQIKDIQGYEGLYKITDDGRIWSVRRDRWMHPTPNKNGYLVAGLCKKGSMKSFYVHRLVAEAFIPNTDNLPEINHKDENHQNNLVCNLEWCSHSYNIRYGTRTERAIEGMVSTKVANGIFTGCSKELNYKKNYNKKRNSQLWANGTEVLPWSTLNNRGHKSDLIAQGWHKVNSD